MISLSVPNLKGNEWKYIKECLDTNWVSSSGGFVDDFECAICKYTKAQYAVACVNGTSALFIALKVAGIGANEEVIVPTLTFIAPINAVKYLNAEPIFMDCDNYMNLDVEKLNEFCKKECRVTKKGLKNKLSGRIIKAILPVHVFGNPCNMEQIMNIARKYDLRVIEDATESLGAYYTAGTYKNKFTGTIGDLGVYSFNGNKIITTGGGGMIITRDRNLAKKARYLTEQAKDDPVRSIHNEIGYNFRLSNLQAALGLAQLRQLNSFIKIKKINYALYKSELRGVSGIEVMGVPENTRPNYWFYSLVIDKKEYGMDREELMSKLLQMDIQTRPIWYLSHLQKPYRNNQAYRIEKAICFWEKILNLPCSSNLEESEVKRVSAAIRKFQKSKWKN